MAVVCNDKVVRGTGSTICDLGSFGDLTGFIALNKGVPIEDISTESTYKNAILANQIHPLVGIYNFEQSTPENERATSSIGVITKIRDGKPQFSLTFTKGGCFHKALYSLSGYNRFDIALVFEKGILVADENGVSKGFSAGTIDVETFKLQQGSDPQSSTVMLQLTNATQFNERHKFISFDELGFDANSINGAIEVDLSIGTNTATSIPVRVTAGCSQSVAVTGIDEVSMWRVINLSTNQDVAVTAVAESSNGNYTLSGTGFPTSNLMVIVNGEDEAVGDIYKGRQIK